MGRVFVYAGNDTPDTDSLDRPYPRRSQQEGAREASGTYPGGYVLRLVEI